MPPPVSKQSPPPPEISQGRAAFLARRRRRRWIIRSLIGVPIVLGIAAIILWKPLYLRFKNWRTDRIAGEAKSAADKSDWQTAFDRAATVLLSKQNDFTSAWLLFVSMKALKSPAAVDVGAWLIAQPDAKTDQKYEILKLMAAEAAEASFFNARLGLSEDERGASRFRALYAGVLIRRGDLWLADLVLRWTPGFSSEPKVPLELVRLLCLRKTARDLTEAWQVFRSLKKDNYSAEALEALRLIAAASDSAVFGKTEPGLSFWINQQPLATSEDKLMAHDIDIAQGREKESAVLEEVLRDFGVSQSPLDAATVGRWLNRRGRPDQAITLLTASAASDGPAFLALVEAYIKASEADPAAKSSRLDAASKLLSSPPPKLNAVELQLAKVDVARARAEKTTEDQAWADAVRAADTITAKNWGFEVSMRAAQLGREDQWLTAQAAALRHRRGPLPLFTRCQPVIAALAKQDRLPEILDICRNLALFEPRNEVLENNLLYLQLITGELSPPAVIPGMQELCRKFPASAGYARSLSFALLLNRQPIEAIRLLEAIAENPPSPLQRALMGTAYRLGGQEEKGKALLSSLEWSDRRLYRKEVALLQGILALHDEAIAKAKADKEKAGKDKPRVP